MSIRNKKRTPDAYASTGGLSFQIETVLSALLPWRKSCFGSFLSFISTGVTTGI